MATESQKILNTLKNGSVEEIGNVLTAIAKSKDPQYNGLLKGIMNSGDPFLSVMAAYALGETGEKAGFHFIEKILHQDPTRFVSPMDIPDAKTLEEILRLPGELNLVFDYYNSSYFEESKGKFLKILNFLNLEPAKTGSPHFDNLINFSQKKGKGMILDALAVCEFHLGKIEEALNYSKESIGIAEEVGDPQLLKIAYADQGHFQMVIGNYYRAMELLQKSLEIDEDTHDPWRKKNRTLSNLSQLYYQIGDYKKALEYSQDALESSEKEQDLPGMAKSLNALGVVLCEINEEVDAKQCLEEALDLAENDLKDISLQCLILNNLAMLNFSLSKTEEAKRCLLKALEIGGRLSNKVIQGNILTSMAWAESESGNFDTAERYAESSLKINKEIYNLPGQVDAKYLLGRIRDYAFDDSDTAYAYYQSAIQLSETLRNNLLLDDFKIAFAANQELLFQEMILLCIRLGKKDEAFKYVEQSKSRALVDMLASTIDAIRPKTISPEEAEKIATLRGRLDLLRKQIVSSYSTTQAGSSEKKRDSSFYDMEELEKIYLKTLEELKLKDPQWTSMISADVANINTIQSKMTTGSIIIELYHAGGSVLIFLIGKDGAPSVLEIPIEVETDFERIYTLFEALSTGKGINTRSHEYLKEIKQPLSFFHDLIITPLANFLTDIDHLIIIPHSVWHYLPFHALYDKESNEFLIDQYSISYASSATALDLSCRENPQFKTALILVNPSGDLPLAEMEGEIIKKKFGADGHIFKKGAASWERLSEYNSTDIIHLACHGYFRGDKPILSNLILSDDKGMATPFFLPDIFNLDIKTSLLALSACETGLSQFTPGDELIGISRAFFYAGASSILSSLWPVNDKSTSILMDKFYDGLIASDINKAKSLRSAICELKVNPVYSHPYFWAPFFLSGDYR